VWIDDVNNEISKNTGRTAKVHRYVIATGHNHLKDVRGVNFAAIKKLSGGNLICAIGLPSRIMHKMLDANF
jgi:hypothetical protein